MEEIPFIYGKIAIGKDFCDREKETTYLVQYFTSLINAIIISPRGWGKSSLVNKAAKLAMVQDSNLRICHIDLFNVRSKEHFLFTVRPKGHCCHFHKMGGGNRECEEFLFASCSQDFNRYRLNERGFNRF